MRGTAYAWTMVILVSAVAIYVWGSSLRWQFTDLSAYQFFPILGLLAFSIMWTHYITGFLRRTFSLTNTLTAYYRYTGYVVLVAIVLHPGILIYQRFHDGFGLPPGSYESYVAPSMAWITLLGSVSLLIFLAFELHRWFKNKPWWKYVVGAGDVAMLAIFYHGLELGTQTHVGWFRVVWYFYGIVLVLVLIPKYLGFLLNRSSDVTH